MNKHPAYKSFNAAKSRCSNVENKAYGGRGIRFNFSSFEEFWTHIGSTWRPGLSLDRIDNNGHYEIGNVRYVSLADQARNRRSTVWLEHNGRRLTLSEWSREIGLDKSTLSWRYKHYGADPAKLLAPKRP
jgi:hypothetical protein